MTLSAYRTVSQASPETDVVSAGGRFPTTQWSLVLAAGGGESTDALSRLCTLYWYPIFAFVRRQGHSPEDAQDLTQGFFTRLIEKGDIGDADRSRGRFRTFLLTSCQHFISNERDRSRAQKRGGGRPMISIDLATAEGRYDRAFSDSETPERVFDRQWSLTLLGSVLDGLRNDYAAAGNERLFDRLSAFLTLDDNAGTHADAARDLGMTPDAVKMALHRLRRKYRDALRRSVADTVGSPDEVEDELRYLLKALGD